MNDKMTIELTGGTATFIRLMSARLRVTPAELIDIIVTRRAAELQATAEVYRMYDFTEVMTVTENGIPRAITGTELLNILIPEFVKKYEDQRERILVETEKYDIRCLSPDDVEFLKRRRAAELQATQAAAADATYKIQGKHTKATWGSEQADAKDNVE